MNGIHAALEGRISEPQLHYTAGGQAVLQFSLVVLDSKAQAGAEPEWVRVAVWGERAEELAPLLKKGVEVYAEGRIRLNKWEGANGEQRTGLSLSAWACQPKGLIGERAPRKPTPGRHPAPIGNRTPRGEDDPWGGPAA